MIKYPYARPNVTKKDIKAVTNALSSQFLTGGEIVKRFEKKLVKSFEAKNAIVCNSGTAALHLIYKSLGLSSGDAILTTPITFVATANAAKMCNANVYFADVDPETGLIIPELIEKKLKNKKLKIKIVTVVHLGGRLCNLEKIAKITKQYDCFLVEDACHAPGVFYENQNKIKSKIGSCKYSIASSFSFHAIKHITMAEGGCVTTNNAKLASKIRSKLSHSMIRKLGVSNKKSNFYQPWYYEVTDLGWNYRASEINCALGLSQLSRLKEIIRKRKNIARIYFEELKNFNYIDFPKNAFSGKSNAWHLFTILINFKKYNLKKLEVVKALSKAGVGTQVHYIPIFMQPYFKEKSEESYKGAIEYYKKNLSIPMYETLTRSDVVYICKKIKLTILEQLSNSRKKGN